MSDRKNYFMYIIGNNDSGFDFFCPAYSKDQAIAYAKHLYGFNVRIRDVREIC
jgi:hypothetical protein